MSEQVSDLTLFLVVVQARLHEVNYYREVEWGFGETTTGTTAADSFFILAGPLLLAAVLLFASIIIIGVIVRCWRDKLAKRRAWE